MQGFAERVNDSHVPLLPLELASTYEHLHLDSLQKMANHQLNILLRFKPVYTIPDCVKHQEDLTYSKLTPFRRAFFKQFFVVLDASTILNVIQGLSEVDEFSWFTLLSFISTFLVCFQTAPTLLKNFITMMLKQGLENQEFESAISALLFARQSCFEGLHIFPSYPEWFEITFGSPKSVSNSPKRFIFLIRMLSDLVPFESPLHLKAHLLKNPFIPTGCSEVFSDYVTLIKTRLIDLKQNWHSGTSSGDYQACVENQTFEDLENDVASAVDNFISLGKIPANILQSIIFRRPYFVGHFLPTLLKPCKLPTVPDPRMKLIKALKDAGKIPGSQYINYIQACHQLKMASVNDQHVMTTDDNDSNMSNTTIEKISLQNLEELFQQLEETVSQLEKLTENVSKTKVSETVSLISECLKTLLAEPQNAQLLLTENKCLMTLDVVKPTLENNHIQIANTLLNSASKIFLLSKYPSDYECNWSRQLFDVISANFQLLPAIFHCLWRWTILQWDLLSPEHILGLGAILCNMTLCHSCLPQVQIINCPLLGESIGRFCDLLWSALPCSTSNQTSFLLQLSTVFLKAFFCVTDDIGKTALLPSTLITKFIYICERKYPFLRFGNCPNESPNEEVVLYQSEAFALIKNQHQIKFQNWIQLELSIDPCLDYLSNQHRKWYHDWFISKYHTENKNGYEMCSVIFNCILEADISCEQSSIKKCTKCETNSAVSLYLIKNKYEIVCLLKRNIKQLLDNEKNVDTEGSSLPWLLQTLQESIPFDFCKSKLLISSKIDLLLNLPVYHLFSNSISNPVSETTISSFIKLINTSLRNYSNEGFMLQTHVADHIFQGILASGQSIADDFFKRLLTECPLLWTSLMVYGKHWKIFHLLMEQKHFQTITDQILQLQMFDEWENLQAINVDIPCVLQATALASVVLERKSNWTKAMLSSFGTEGFQQTTLLKSIGTIIMQFPSLLQALVNGSLQNSEELILVVPDNSKIFTPVVFFQVVMAIPMDSIVNSLFCDQSNINVLLRLLLKVTELYNKQCDQFDMRPSLQKHCSHAEKYLTIQDVLNIGSFVKKIIRMVPSKILQAVDSKLWQCTDLDIQKVYKESVDLNI
ncbi:hypothetical protein Ahia01_000304200 [Argonauta hians]